MYDLATKPFSVSRSSWSRVAAKKSFMREMARLSIKSTLSTALHLYTLSPTLPLLPHYYNRKRIKKMSTSGWKEHNWLFKLQPLL